MVFLLKSLTKILKNIYGRKKQENLFVLFP